MSTPGSPLVFDRRTSLFVSLAATFVTMLLVGDIIGGKLQQVTLFNYDFLITVGMIPFPVTFLLTDLLNEFYGKRAARFITMVGFAMAVLTFLIIFVAVKLPWPAMTEAPDYGGVRAAAYDSVFGGSQRFLAASMVAYLASQFADIAVFNALKNRTGGRLLWLRATGSTAVSQLVDTVAIQALAWGGVLPFEKIVSLVITSYVVKFVIAVALTPAIYAGHSVLERRFGLTPAPAEHPAAEPPRAQA